MGDYLAERGDSKGLARVALRRMEHFYYKTDAVYDAMRKLAVQQQEAANAVQVCALQFACAGRAVALSAPPPHPSAHHDRTLRSPSPCKHVDS